MSRTRNQIEEVRAENWIECQSLLERVRSEHNTALTGVWFRGQSNASWELKTTLERSTPVIEDVGDYFRLVRRIKPEIEAFTSRTWSLPSHHEVERACEDFDGFRDMIVSAYAYLAHLRHHGFPSPLLDWSGSPYIAAYFSFRNAMADDDVAVYSYCEQPDNMKETSSDRPMIIALGPIVQGHTRHFRQQSRYTICCSFAERRWIFTPHQKVFGLNRFVAITGNQDILKKVVFPAKERAKILREFDQYNLNDYTLFGSEEALMTTLATRELGK